MRRKLKVNRETLRRLDARSVRHVAGADTADSDCAGACVHSDYCPSWECTPNTGGTRSQGPFNCNDRTSSIDIPCY
jgi:hypothetical protein